MSAQAAPVTLLIEVSISPNFVRSISAVALLNTLAVSGELTRCRGVLPGGPFFFR
jgi:hypothetical protein